MKAGELSGPSTSGRGSDDLDLLWSTFCTEARQTLPPPPVNAEFPVGCLPAEMDDDLLAEEDSRLPPPLLGSGQSEAEMQSDYITMLETFVQERQQQQQQPLVEWQNRNEAPPAGWTSEALRLRQENRMLRAKNTMLDRQLREAHNRCRRAEQINARWRLHLSALRKREREEGEQRRKIDERAKRSGVAEQHNAHLREQLKAMSAELGVANQRALEAESTCVHLRAALSQAMGSLSSSALALP